MGSEWILGRLTGGCLVGSVDSGYGQVVGFCEHGDGNLRVLAPRN
jgi:hypothetical protein